MAGRVGPLPSASPSPLAFTLRGPRAGDPGRRVGARCRTWQRPWHAEAGAAHVDEQPRSRGGRRNPAHLIVYGRAAARAGRGSVGPGRFERHSSAILPPVLEARRGPLLCTVRAKPVGRAAHPRGMRPRRVLNRQTRNPGARTGATGRVASTRLERAGVLIHVSGPDDGPGSWDLTSATQGHRGRGRTKDLPRRWRGAHALLAGNARGAGWLVDRGACGGIGAAPAAAWPVDHGGAGHVAWSARRSESRQAASARVGHAVYLDEGSARRRGRRPPIDGRHRSRRAPHGPPRGRRGCRSGVEANAVDVLGNACLARGAWTARCAGTRPRNLGATDVDELTSPPPI